MKAIFAAVLISIASVIIPIALVSVPAAAVDETRTTEPPANGLPAWVTCAMVCLR